MKLVIDYTPAIRQSAGIGRIIRGQIEALFEHNPGYDLSLFVAGKVDNELKARAPLPLLTFPALSERNLTRLWHRLNIPLPRVEWLTGGGYRPLSRHRLRSRAGHGTPKTADQSTISHLFHYPDAAMPTLQHYLNVVVPRSIRPGRSSDRRQP